ncbi:hypothetical protein JTE90_025920 [Oedothorax gibbosus]|uniref:Uncharacterized protein n=1 Tax=Oedothorax gibbosus TaxID=931172 RepID=A0AAV6USY3_9ARAC|nr:hypothetical protein JTE90_025920 [Oedothorax gibbosus]
MMVFFNLYMVRSNRPGHLDINRNVTDELCHGYSKRQQTNKRSDAKQKKIKGGCREENPALQYSVHL